MSKAGGSRPKILVAHQWKAERGLYGADRVMVRILRELSPHADLIVVIESEGEFAEVAREIGCAVLVRNFGVLRRLEISPIGLGRLAAGVMGGAIWLARLIVAEKIDLVFTSTVSVTAAALAAKMTGRRHLWFIQEVLVGYKRALLGPVRLLSDRVIAVSNASARSLHLSNQRSLKVTVCYPGVDARRFDSMGNLALRASFGGAGQILIAHVARLHYWKGQDYLLEALNVLKKRGLRNFRAFFVGEVYPGYESLREELREKVRKFNLEQEVQFLGHRENVESIFMAVDIAVSPSTLPDPCPLVVAEAMAARLPVVATAAGGHLELIEDGVSGILIPVNDPSTFADRLAQLIADSAFRQRLGAAARERVETRFPASGFDQEIVRIIHSMLAR